MMRNNLDTARLSDIKGYQAYLFDVWGCLHNGYALFAGVKRVLEYIKQNLGAPLLLLTNASCTSCEIADYLSAFGLRHGYHYDKILTAGEACAYVIKENNWVGCDCHMWGKRGSWILQRCQLRHTENLEKVKFLLVSDMDDMKSRDSEYIRGLLGSFRQLDIPLVCMNPDKLALKGRQQVLCPGVIVDVYREMGGRVILAGKPAGEIYRMFKQELKEMGVVDLDPAKVLAFGDGLYTDIGGGLSCGFKTVLASFGLPHTHIVDAKSGEISIEKLYELCVQEGVMPHYYIQSWVDISTK